MYTRIHACVCQSATHAFYTQRNTCFKRILFEALICVQPSKISTLSKSDLNRNSRKTVSSVLFERRIIKWTRSVVLMYL